MAIDAGTVLILITLVVLPIAAISFARSGGAWKRIGKGEFAIEQELQPARPSAGPPPVNRHQQAAEARQMIEAKSYRRTQREAPLDVEAEVSRVLAAPLEAPTIDDELREEVRRLVVSRNERRLRRGEPELDVEAETERQLAEFA